MTLEKGKNVSKQGLTSITSKMYPAHTAKSQKKEALVMNMWPQQDLNFEIYVSQAERSRNSSRNC